MELADISQVIAIVSEAADPTLLCPLELRRRRLISGVAHLISADIWMWTTGVNNPESPGDAMLTQCMDGGFRSPEERAEFIRISLDPRLVAVVQAPLAKAVLSGRNATYLRSQLMSDKEWENTAVAEQWMAAGFGDFILTAVSIPFGHSSAGFHRRLACNRFSQHEARLVSAIFQNVPWLHNQIKDSDIADDTLALSPRERQVLVLLLDGGNRQQIADALQLSIHTVIDYLKVIYRKLGVNSQRELIAKFARSV